MTTGMLAIEVVYALPERQTLIALALPPGARAADAIAASGIRELHPELRGSDHAIGIFGRVVAPEHALEDGDRVEVYRPLAADPKASRNARVARKRQQRDDGRNMCADERTKSHAYANVIMGNAVLDWS